MDTTVLDAAVCEVFKAYLEPYATSVGPYNDKSKGIPQELVWNGKRLWRSDGSQFCSGAVWWLLVELLKLAGLETLPALQDGRILEDLRQGAWVWEDSKNHGGLPEALVRNGLGVWICEGEVNPDPSVFQAGRFYQFWTSWSQNIGYKGHTGFIKDGLDDAQEAFVEWSSSPVHTLNPATQRQTIAKKKWFIAALHPDVSNRLASLIA